MKSLTEFNLSEGVEAAEIDSKGQEAANFLQTELRKLLPDWYAIYTNYGLKLGRSLTVTVYDTRKPSIKVTRHNSENHFAFMMYLSGSFGQEANFSKVSFEKSMVHSTNGVKYRKVSGKNIMDASKKLVAWFKRNRDKMIEAPMTQYQ